jgi:hypothetical protein
MVCYLEQSNSRLVELIHIHRLRPDPMCDYAICWDPDGVAIPDLTHPEVRKLSWYFCLLRPCGLYG